MIDGALFALALLSALGCGLAAGVFFCFSAFVMKALDRLPAPQGIAAMQAINSAAVTPVFMTALLGTALTCAVLGAGSLAMLDEPFARYLFAGSVLYLLGVILPTVAYHVPRNQALAAVDAASTQAAPLWARYLAGWTAWNHLRAAAALSAMAALIGALSV